MNSLRPDLNLQKSYRKDPKEKYHTEPIRQSWDVIVLRWCQLLCLNSAQTVCLVTPSDLLQRTIIRMWFDHVSQIYKFKAACAKSVID